MAKKIVFILFILNALSVFSSPQNLSDSIQIQGGIASPTGFYNDKLNTGSFFSLQYNLDPIFFTNFFLQPEISVLSFKAKINDSIHYKYFPFSLNGVYQIPLSDSFFIPFSAGLGGYYLTTSNSGTFLNFYAKASTGINFLITNELFGGLSFGYHYFHDPEPLKSYSIQLSLSYSFQEPETGYGLKIVQNDFNPIFSAQSSKYFQTPIGKITLDNKTGKPIEDVKASFYIKNFMSGKTESLQKLPILKENNQATIHIYAFFDKNLKYLTADTQTTGTLELEYKDQNGKKHFQKTAIPVFLYHKNTLNWNNLNHIGSFITLEDKPIIELSRKMVNLIKNKQNLPDNLAKALIVFNLFKFYQLKYINDPQANYKIQSSESKAVNFVQYPRETLVKKTGNCVDFSVLFSAILESMGIPTAIVSAPEHVFILFETSASIANKTLFFQGKHWIPIETTLFNKDFPTAWKSAYDYYLQTKEKQIKTTLEAITEFPPVTFENDIYLNYPVSQYEFEKSYFEQEELILKFFK